jgi:hypothetical protein
MIITRKYIYVHPPKTGGTFVSEIVKKIALNTLMKRVENRIFRNVCIDINKHGTCSRIPANYRHLPIFSTIRNPYDRYVSQYEFSWWQKYPEQFSEIGNIVDICPNFPHISFREFVHLANKTFFRLDPAVCREKNIGWQTEQFVQYFFKQPEAVVRKLHPQYVATGQYREDLYDVKFIHMEHLNRELHDLLISLGHKAAEVAFILPMEKINPVEGGRSLEQKWFKYYDEDLKNYVREKERYLFELFPEYCG